MKKIIISACLLFFTYYISVAQQNVGIGTINPDTSALLELSSTDKGVLIPRMSSTQRNSISSPANALLVYDTDTRSFWFYQDDQWMEIGASRMDNNIDLPIPTPFQIDSSKYGHSITTLTGAGDYLYLTENTTDTAFVTDTLLILDVSNPLNKITVSRIAVGENPSIILAHKDHVYITDGNDNLLRIFNVENPGLPTLASSVLLGPAPIDMAIDNDKIYITDLSEDNVRIIDIQDPANPILLHTHAFGQLLIGVEVQNDIGYFIDPIDLRMIVMDFQNPIIPQEIGSLNLDSEAFNFPSDIKVNGSHAYVIDQNGHNLKVIDIANPAAPVQIGYVNFGSFSSPRRLVVNKDYAFITDWNNDGVLSVDISNPTNPQLIAITPVGPTPEEIVVLGNFGFVMEQFSGSLKTIKISAPLPVGIDINGQLVDIQSFPGDTIAGGGMQQLILEDTKLSITSGNTVNLNTLSGWKINGDEMYNLNEGNIGIGTEFPQSFGGDKVLELVGPGQDQGSILQLSNLDRKHYLRFFGGRQYDKDPLVWWADSADLRFVTDRFGYNELMRINHDGKLGIGTGPDVQLQLSLGDSDTGLQQEGDGELQIYTDFNPVMRFTNQANVGVGKTFADEKLDVDGNVKATGFIGDGSQITGIPYPDDSPINELQTLSVNGTDLTLSNGNTVTIPVSGGGAGVWGLNGEDGIYNMNTQNVGIKVTTPKTAFHIGENQRILFGADTTGFGSRMIWAPSKGSMRMGTLEPGFWGDEANWFDPDSMGTHSFAAGYNVLASGNMGSVALGHYNRATGYNGSFAAGTSNEATGEEGSVAIGSFNIASGNFGATAIGDGNFAAGSSGSTAFGTGSFSNGSRGVLAMGYFSFASGADGTAAIGNSATATGVGGAIALGEFVNANGNHGSMALGYQSNASGDWGATAIGDNAKAIGHHGATAIGKNTIASSYGMVSLGHYNDTLPGWSRNAFIETDPVLTVGIGNGIFNDFYERKTGLTLLKNGHLGIGTMSPDQQLTITHPINPVLRFERNGNPGFADWEMHAIDGRIAIRGGGNGVGAEDLTEFFAIEGIDGRVTIPHLAGNGTRMVVTDGLGKLKAMDLPDDVEPATPFWFEDGDDIYFDGGKVGIGTSNPRTDLSINGSLGIGPDYSSNGIGVTFPAGGAMIQGNVGIGSTLFEVSNAPQALTIMDDQESVLRFQSGGALFDWEIYTDRYAAPNVDTRFSIRGGSNGIGSALTDFYTIEKNGFQGDPLHEFNGNMYFNDASKSSIVTRPGAILSFGHSTELDDNRLKILPNGQVAISNNIGGDGETIEDYGLHIDARDQGMIIELDGFRPDQSNTYIQFAGDPGPNNWTKNGRIAGQSTDDLTSSFDFVWTTTFSAVDLGFTLAESISCAAQADVFEVVSVGLQGVSTVIQYDEWLINSALNVGVSYESGSGDYAEWLPKGNPDEEFKIGDVVGIKAGVVSYETADADHIMVVSKSPIVLGNMPEDGENPGHFEKIAFLGQVQTKVIGVVNKGDYILASGHMDGMGIAKSAEEMTIEDYSKIVGVAWSESKSRTANLINVAVGINANDVSHALANQQKTISRLEEEVAELRSMTSEILSHLKGEKLELNENQNTVFADVEKVGTMTQSENLSVSTTLSIKENFSPFEMSDEAFRNLLESQEEIIFKQLNELKEMYVQNNIDISKFPRLQKVYDDPIQAMVDIKNGKLFPTLSDQLKERSINDAGRLRRR